MHLSFFNSRHSLITLLSLSIFICGSVAIANTKIQENIDAQAQVDLNNPHHIPGHMNPKLYRISNEVVAAGDEIGKEVEEVADTLHSIAFRGHRSYAEPIHDYTTGTLN